MASEPSQTPSLENQESILKSSAHVDAAALLNAALQDAIKDALKTSSQSQSLTQTIAAKLDDNNFLTWKMQVMAAVKGYDLKNYLTGGKHIPKRFLSDADEAEETENPEFLKWEKQDQVLMYWLLNSMTEGMTSKMVGCSSSADVWRKVESLFVGQTKAKERQLRTQLRAIKKSGLGMSEFLLKIKKIVDSLAAIGSTVTDHEHISTIFEGLPAEYESFVTSFSMRTEDQTVIDVEALLLAHEARLEAFKSASDNISANSRSTKRTRKKRQWQIFMATKSSSVSATLLASQQSQSQPPRPSSNLNPPVEAHFAAPETLYDPAWYPDSGASNHITNDSTNLQASQSYSGSDQVHVANGTDLFHVPSDTHQTLLKGRLHNGLYLFDDIQLSHKAAQPPHLSTAQTSHKAATSTPSANALSLSNSCPNTLSLWHYRLDKTSSHASQSLFDLSISTLPITISSPSFLNTETNSIAPVQSHHNTSASFDLSSGTGTEECDTAPVAASHPSTTTIDPPTTTSLQPTSCSNPSQNTTSASSTQSAKCDNSLFIKITTSSALYVLVYVDDVIITGSSKNEIQALVSKLHTQFSLKDLGPLHYFLGIQVIPSSGGGLLLSQSKYIKDLLLKAALFESKPQKTPMVSGLKLSASTGDDFEDPHFYRSIISIFFILSLLSSIRRK
ncbi:Retrovirus-related Pol polyprotein from transposon TNT 1-94 [Senna tora]|uniref:Retrovirus-related Pol polyprotein from transposon TNT 1-94 n=1 Tax=Senna tora TaxID=362788 RepID=A0A835CIW0_9FABA|nr:Retrovirus-related Pol polyprotein from transposon TNT 1-94 [Senna tora]